MECKTKEQLQAWWQASRPAFYVATLVPLALGFILAGKDTGEWKTGLFLLILLCSFFLHLSANLANDVFDHLLGVDNQDTIGGSRALQQGKITLKQYAWALVLLYAGSLLLAWLGVLCTGLAGIWGIVIFAVLASFFYVAPPVRYGHRALGEVFVFLSMGVVMTAGTYYTLTGIWEARAFALSLPVGLMVAGILYYQSLPEIDTDRAAGKRTLAGVLGKQRAVLLFRVWWPAVWLLQILLVPAGIASALVIFGVVAAIPLYLKTLHHLENAGDDWLPLDSRGHLVRKMYLICGLALIAGVIWN